MYSDHPEQLKTGLCISSAEKTLILHVYCPRIPNLKFYHGKLCFHDIWPDFQVCLFFLLQFSLCLKPLILWYHIADYNYLLKYNYWHNDNITFKIAWLIVARQHSDTASLPPYIPILSVHLSVHTHKKPRHNTVKHQRDWQQYYMLYLYIFLDYLWHFLCSGFKQNGNI